MTFDTQCHFIDIYENNKIKENGKYFREKRIRDQDQAPMSSF